MRPNRGILKTCFQKKIGRNKSNKAASRISCKSIIQQEKATECFLILFKPFEELFKAPILCMFTFLLQYRKYMDAFSAAGDRLSALHWTIYCERTLPAARNWMEGAENGPGKPVYHWFVLMVMDLSLHRMLAC